MFKTTNMPSSNQGDNLISMKNSNIKHSSKVLHGQYD